MLKIGDTLRRNRITYTVERVYPFSANVIQKSGMVQLLGLRHENGRDIYMADEYENGSIVRLTDVS